MSITEPTGWEADCALWGCNVTAEQDDRIDDEGDWTDTLRQWGWIVMSGDYTFHSLDCLLTYRMVSNQRKHMGHMFQIHADYRHTGNNCCAEHGRHRTGGDHDLWCPERVRRATIERQIRGTP